VLLAQAIKIQNLIELLDTTSDVTMDHDAASSIIRIMNVVMWILHGGCKN
jgi:hypothetical protein